jgi:hypothetical protein
MAGDTHFEDFGFGASWVQREALERASHALRSDGKVWLVDPLDTGDDVARAIGDAEPAGVIQLLDRHNRDCAAIAERLGVPHLRLPEELPGTPLTPFSVIDRPKWREVGLWWPEHKALVVSEAIGTSKAIAIADTGVSLHPLLRLTPPGAIRRYVEVEHLLPGHGRPLHDPRAGEKIQRALDKSRSDLPRMITRMPALIRAAKA